jgi:hypothetical protein
MPFQKLITMPFGKQGLKMIRRHNRRMCIPSKRWDGKGAFKKTLEMKATKEEWKLD